MTINIELEEVTDLIKEIEDYESLCNHTVETCVDYMKCPYETEVNILLTNNEVIHQVNLEQREIDKPTDVLSFPMIEWDEIGSFDFLEDALAYFHPDTGELMLGDIVLSINKVEEQAEEYGHSNIREFTFLIVHSMLHLFGYDHMEALERTKMEKAQAEIMDILRITRQ